MKTKKTVVAEKRLRVCKSGARLLTAFLILFAVAAIAFVSALIFVKPKNAAFWQLFVWSAVFSALILTAVFWAGIIKVYLSSVQLGIKLRVIGALCGFIPIVNLVVLCKIIGTAFSEVSFEQKKILLDKQRKKDELCKTKYPVLLVHGVFFRDFKYFNYWGRIPEALENNGAKIYYGNHDSAMSVSESGKALAKRIEEIVSESGCEKLNIIAHSKGGLDCRYAISICGADKYVASLTTINTPHRGCLFADYLLEKAPQGLKVSIASAYNASLKKLGDKSPDFIAAVTDLTDESCKRLNEKLCDMQGVLYQSVGSRLAKARGGKFPLNFSYHIVKHFGGENDGLVSLSSFEHGSKYILLEPKGKRGVSHGDMIDLNRENIKGFDVREFYVEMVSKLKKAGL